jgi:hypothetical protein
MANFNRRLALHLEASATESGVLNWPLLPWTCGTPACEHGDPDADQSHNGVDTRLGNTGPDASLGPYSRRQAADWS